MSETPPLLTKFAWILERSTKAPSGEPILEACLDLAEMLIAKNVAYGDSAVDPVRVFSRADSLEQIQVRMDDKLSRIQRGSMQDEEDPRWDLAGYLILDRVIRSSTGGPRHGSTT